MGFLSVRCGWGLLGKAAWLGFRLRCLKPCCLTLVQAGEEAGGGPGMLPFCPYLLGPYLGHLVLRPLLLLQAEAGAAGGAAGAGHLGVAAHAAGHAGAVAGGGGGRGGKASWGGGGVCLLALCSLHLRSFWARAFVAHPLILFSGPSLLSARLWLLSLLPHSRRASRLLGCPAALADPAFRPAAHPPAELPCCAC